MIGVFFTSCISFNNSDNYTSENGEVIKNRQPPNSFIEKKVTKSLKLIRGKTINLSSTATFKVLGKNNKQKLNSTMIVIFGDGKDLLGSGPAAVIDNKTLELNSRYKYFEITEKFENSVRKSKIKSKNNILEYELSL